MMPLMRLRSGPLTALVLLHAIAAAALGQLNRPAGNDALPYGGQHEVGVWSGYSGFSGPIWGYSRDVHYSPTDLRYSFLITPDAHHLAIRYAPEITLVAVLCETQKTEVNPLAPVCRFGSGLSPEAFQFVFRPLSRVQPFVSNAGGLLYFNDRVLSPQGSQFMYTIDFGGGVNLFASRSSTITLGYRYQHLSNANISIHNPGTDADTFYVGYSHFYTRGPR